MSRRWHFKLGLYSRSLVALNCSSTIHVEESMQARVMDLISGFDVMEFISNELFDLSE